MRLTAPKKERTTQNGTKRLYSMWSLKDDVCIFPSKCQENNLLS